jgi:putative methyltransferase
MDRGVNANLLYIDETVPNLIAVPSHTNITTKSSYKEGKLILQDKASCFPAFLLDPASIGGDIIDACAAPGNKTTHLAALVASTEPESGRAHLTRKIFACERDALRSQTLAKMVKLAGAEDMIHIKSKQDFMKLKPESKQFAHVTCLLLDPSCSGSGIVGRDEVAMEIHLPDASKEDDKAPRGKKRKRNGITDRAQSNLRAAATMEVEELPPQLPAEDSKLQARLAALSSFQLRLLQHAMAFPAAQRITYSTCSLYDQENEHVVVKALLSDVARERGWRILGREDQIQGLRNWKKRGKLDAVAEILVNAGISNANLDGDVISDGCIRCGKNSEDGTMGFFVAGFIRDAEASKKLESLSSRNSSGMNGKQPHKKSPENTDEQDEWNGFSDEDT